MEMKEPPQVVVSYEDMKGDQENQYNTGGNGGNTQSNTTSTNNGGYKKHYHGNRYRQGQGYHNHSAGNHRHQNGYNNFNNHNGYHTNYHGGNNRPYANKRQFHNNDYFPPQNHHMYPHPSHHPHSQQHGQHHGSNGYYSNNHYYPPPYSHSYHSKNTSQGNHYLSTAGTTSDSSMSSLSPEVSQMSTSAGSNMSMSLSEGSDSRGSSRPSSAEDCEEPMTKTSPEVEGDGMSANSSTGSSLASKSPTPCFPTPESLDNMLPPCVNPIASSGPRISGGGSTRHGGWGDSPDPHNYLNMNKSYYPFPPHNAPPIFHHGSNLNDRHLPLPQFQPNHRFSRRDGPYEVYHPGSAAFPYPNPNYFMNGLGGQPCEPHPMTGPAGGPGSIHGVFNPGPQFTFPDSLPQSNEPNKLMNLNEKTGVYEWTSCEDVMDIPRIGSPSTLPGASQGALTNRIFPKKRLSPASFTTHYDKGSSTIGQNGYSRKPFHLQGRPHSQWPYIRAEDYLNNYHFIAESDKPELLAPVGSEWIDLTEQIWVKFQTNQQSMEMYKNKIELWRQLSEIVKAYNPSYSLEVVGSTVSGFGSNTSDVDMCLLLNNRIDLSDRDEALEILETIGPKLKSIPNIENNELIHAKVPILKFKDSVHNLDVDINVNNAVGLRNTQLLFGYAQCDWRVRPLILVVKLWANFQGINDAKMMTLSSYSLSLMVIHYLQHAVAPAVLPCLQQSHPERYSCMVGVMKVRKSFNDPLVNFDISQNTETLAELLLGFLEYYSVKFDYKTQAVSVRTGSTVAIRHCMYNKATKNDPYQWKHMCIEECYRYPFERNEKQTFIAIVEPFEYTNTARSVYEKDSFDRVRGVFFASWQRLSRTRDLESIFKPISPSEARMIGSKIRS